MAARASRSSLIFPVHVLCFLERAWTRNAETITLDLEDAVNPKQKPYARTLMKDAIGIAARGGSECESTMTPCWKSVRPRSGPGCEASTTPRRSSRRRSKSWTASSLGWRRSVASPNGL